MLSVNNLNAWFPDPSAMDFEGDEIQVLRDVCLEIKEGQTVALAGESGSGKSITALSILRLLEESTAIRVNGTIEFQGRSLLDLPLDAIRKIRGNHIAMIFQEPMTSLNPVFTIGNQLLEPLQLHRGLAKDKARKEAASLLERCGIEDPDARLDAYPHQMSGGQRQRVMIAMALACNPSLLIADEPTTALDVSTQAQILNLIKDIQQEYQMGMLLITHDLTIVEKIADYIHIMKDGQVLEHGLSSKIFERPEHTYTRHLIEAIPKGSPQKKQDSPPLLEVYDLSCSFKLQTGWEGIFRKRYKTFDAVKNVSLCIKKGSTCGIIGESGSGKTTLGLALLRLIDSEGAIIFDGRDLQGMPTKKLRPIRSRIQIVFQDPFSSLSPRMSIGEIVEEGLRVHRKDLDKRQRRQLVNEALRDVGLTEDASTRYPHEFSGGQRQRIAIARVIILKPELLILDEPTSALDMTIQAQIINLLKKLQDKYDMTYLFITHDLKITRAIADHVVVMKEGKIVEEGNAADIFDNPQAPYTRKLLQAALYSTVH